MGLNLLMEKDASGTTTKTYTHGYSPIDGIGSVVVANDSVHGFQYPTYDHRGTVQEVLDDAETVRNDYEHNAFGEEEKRTEAEANRLTYQSNWYVIRSSDLTETYLLSPVRVYEPGTGRFLQRDPISQGTTDPVRTRTLYVYLENQPVNMVDPRGLIAEFFRNLRTGARASWEWSKAGCRAAGSGIKDASSFLWGNMKAFPSYTKLQAVRAGRGAKRFGEQWWSGARELGPLTMDYLYTGRYNPTPEQLAAAFGPEGVGLLGGHDIQGELGFGPAGGGLGFVTCCDENNCRLRFRVAKACFGLHLGVSASSHALQNIEGKNCPKAYSGWFFEWSAGAFVQVSGEVSVFPDVPSERVSGGGVGLSGGDWQIAMCRYWIVEPILEIGKC